VDCLDSVGLQPGVGDKVVPLDLLVAEVDDLEPLLHPLPDGQRPVLPLGHVPEPLELGGPLLQQVLGALHRPLYALDLLVEHTVPQPHVLLAVRRQLLHRDVVVELLVVSE